ncbi:hypothetical protein CCR75_001264 [Bremia lactucae]|uniref:Uncharacterized protein n=1 Tax=Bremia lactucae TaxID=4779 RepID=A0A976IIL7_BRELC|nr:hypothetical protein CCR75_001264 [Bremia lactucae]
MDILDVNEFPANLATDDSTMSLRMHEPASSLQNESDECGRYDGPQVSSHRTCVRRRHKIGKGIQLILLRKYVHCAKQFSKLPDKETTVQLLEQGYDEYYYQGGNLNERRLSYAAFLKLVRNRRSEAARQNQRGNSRCQRRTTRRYLKEQIEIRALIHELEHIRYKKPARKVHDHGHCSYLDCKRGQAVLTDASVSIAFDSSSGIRDDSTRREENESKTELCSSIKSASDSNADEVVVSRSKLNAMLQVAQETLAAQKKLLEQVRAMEQRVARMQ